MSETVNLNASLNSRGEFKNNTGKPAVEGLWINPDYMLWLEAELAEVKGEGWISVKDALPERFQPVMFVVDCERDTRYHRKVYGGQFQGVMFKGEICEYPGFSIPGIEFRGSHWQPLPDAPTEALKGGPGVVAGQSEKSGAKSRHSGLHLNQQEDKHGN